MQYLQRLTSQVLLTFTVCIGLTMPAFCPHPGSEEPQEAFLPAGAPASPTEKLCAACQAMPHGSADSYYWDPDQNTITNTPTGVTYMPFDGGVTFHVPFMSQHKIPCCTRTLTLNEGVVEGDEGTDTDGAHSPREDFTHITQCPSLTRITAANLQGEFPGFMDSVARAPQITSLHLTRAHTESEDANASLYITWEAKHLNHLTLRNFPDGTSLPLERYTGLKTLCTEEADWNRIIMKNLGESQLEHIEGDYTNMAFLDNEIIGCRTLQTIDMGARADTTLILAYLPSLRTANLSRLAGIENNTGYALQLYNLPLLEEIQIGGLADLECGMKGTISIEGTPALQKITLFVPYNDAARAGPEQRGAQVAAYVEKMQGMLSPHLAVHQRGTTCVITAGTQALNDLVLGPQA